MSEMNEYSALHNGALFFDRSDRMRLRISGPKAAELVTGMVTNDVSSLVAGEGQYAAALTPKGKIVADLRIFALEGALLIDTSAAPAAGWKEMVRKYINPRVAPFRSFSFGEGLFRGGSNRKKDNRFMALPEFSMRQLLEAGTHFGHIADKAVVAAHYFQHRRKAEAGGRFPRLGAEERIE